VLLTRAPLYSWYCYHFLARLACVRHAASVDSEPGSNSRLKPDADLLRRRSELSAAVSRSTAEAASRDTLPCEIDQAKPDRISRLARSTKLSKILEGCPPERNPWDRDPGLASGVSSNLMRLAEIRLFGIRPGRDFASASRVSLARPGFRRRFRPSSRPSAFLRELSKGTKASPTCQGRNLIPVSSLSNSRERPQMHQLAQRKISKIDRQNARARSQRNAQKRIASGSCNGLFSLGNPYRGLRGVLVNSPSPTNRLPTSLNPYVDRGRPLIPRAFAPRATGRLHCHTYSFIRVTQTPARCKPSDQR
jgi:hypothetical protein